MKDLLVMKFGGTSVGSAGRLRVAAELVAREAAKRPVAVVVSAMSKVTDLLLDTLRLADAGDHAGVEVNLAMLRTRHEQTCRDLLPESRQEPVLNRIGDLIDEFARKGTGVAMSGKRPPSCVDEVVGIGEHLSVELLAEYLNASGTPAKAVDARDVVVTDAVFGDASPLMSATRVKAQDHVLPILQRGSIPVVTGFSGATADGRPTTLGRGGSDFSASILAAALDASELWIWTDVDGILTADPRLVPDAQVLPELTYAVATELASNGAKVLHPRTFTPLAEKKIPVWSKNSFAPEKPGTRIVPELDGARSGYAIASMAQVALVSLELNSPELNGGVRAVERAIDAFARLNPKLQLLVRTGNGPNFGFLVRTDELEGTVHALKSAMALEFACNYVRAVHVDRNVGLLAMIGEGLHRKTGLFSLISAAIAGAQVTIIAVVQGSSNLTTAVVVRCDGLEKAVRAVHAGCGLGRRMPASARVRGHGRI